MRSNPWTRATSSIRSSSISMSKRYDGGVTTNASSAPRPDRVCREAEPLEDSGHLARRYGDAEDLLRPRDPHPDGLALGQLRHRVHGRPRFAAADLEDQRGRALDPLHLVVEVDAALEPVRGVAREVVAPRAAGDRLGEEERRLEEHVPRVEIRLRAVAAHDAGEADRAARIGDREHVGVDLDGLLVEELHALAAAPEADVDAALQLVEVVDVERTAHLEHHVVRDVHERGDGALAGALEAALHPLRG